MPISHTNRKGVTFYLCRGLTKTGKPRFFFAREPRDEPVDEVPQGYAITESINGVVSLARIRPSQLLPDEVAAVEAELRRHPDAGRYRVETRHDRLIVHERTAPDLEEMLGMLTGPFMPPRERIEAVRADMDRRARYTPVLRFILANPDRREFRVERMCYLADIDDWIEVDERGSIERLAREVLSMLGTEAFFDLY